MSLAIAAAFHARLCSELARTASPLDAWAKAHTSPAVVLGFPPRDSASDWPFLAILPNSYTRDLRTNKATAASVIVIVGYLAPPDQSQANALLSAEALADASLTSISLPFTADWNGHVWDAGTADRTQITLEHPYYELQLAIDVSPLRRL